MVGLIGLSAFEALAVTTAMPVVVNALGGLDLYAMAFAAPAAASVVGVVAAGGWADRRGPTPPLLAGIAAFVGGLIIGVVGLTLLAVTVPGLLPAGTLRLARGLPSVIALRGLFGAAFFGAEVY